MESYIWIKRTMEFHKKISGFGGADLIEINLKKIDQKYYLNSAHRLHHGYQSDLATWRSSRYDLVDRIQYKYTFFHQFQ